MRYTLAILILVTSLMAGDVSHHSAGGPCCLCSCKAANQKKCAALCIRFQNGRQIVSEGQIERCTIHCKRKGVKQLPRDYFKGYE